MKYSAIYVQGITVKDSIQISKGQRWVSESEPELGLGTVIDNSYGRVKIHFSAGNITRQYVSKSAPIKRARFNPGDSLVDKQGNSFIVERIFEDGPLIFYQTAEAEYCETDLADSLTLNDPIKRFADLDFDSIESYNLRYKTLLTRQKRGESPYRGFRGARINLIPHQLYIAHEVSNRYVPRVILADEVGLGKTIEAALILNKLFLSQIIKSVLIVVPEQLLLQWFCELYHRFNINSLIIDEKHYLELKQEDESYNPFLENQICICSSSLLRSEAEVRDMCLAQSWDMLLIDEAHNIRQGDQEYSFYKTLSSLAKALLLLTAVPEYVDLENFHGLLHLIDPVLYDKYDNFFWKMSNYSFVAKLASKLLDRKKLNKEEINFVFDNLPEEYGKEKLFSDGDIKQDKESRKIILNYLLDQHGLGRVMFRNTRKNVAIFPPRKVVLVPLPGIKKESSDFSLLKQEVKFDISKSGDLPYYDFDSDKRLDWLLSFLREHENEKSLIICTSKQKVEALSQSLEKKKFTAFESIHEDMEFMERDKGVLSFSKEEGPGLLICSEIGSEGRNFQFCRHLIFFDIPFNPAVIEQRIGRLDRIGQKEIINIFLPFIENSPQAVLVKWFHQGLNIFNQFSDSLGQVFSLYRDFVHKIALNSASMEEELNDLIKKTKKDFKAISAKNEAGKDRLIELNSFNNLVTQEIIEDIQTADEDTDLEYYMLDFFAYFGFHYEFIDDRTYVITPVERKTDVFPGIKKKGMAITFDREVATKNENLAFVTRDHHLVDRALELVLQKSTGNSGFVVWPGCDEKAFFLELIYILEPVAPLELNLSGFLCPRIIRVLVDQELKDVSEEITFDLIDDEIMEANTEELGMFKSLIPNNFEQMFDKASVFADNKASLIKEEAETKMKLLLEQEILRLKALKKVNQAIKKEEISQAEHELQVNEGYIRSARLRIESIRAVLKI